MAISRRFPIPFELAFPLGAYLVSEVTPVVDFEKSTREHKVQQVDSDTGKLLWQVDVLDADPEAKRSSKTVSVKIPANVQPVPPGNDGSSPFTPVVFEGLTALPWIERVSEEYSKISWSFRAEDMAAPRRRPAPVETTSVERSSPVSSKSAACIGPAAMTTTEANGTRGWDELLSAAVRMLTDAARLRRTSGAGSNQETTVPADFAEFVTLVVAGAAANVGGIDPVLAGRPGSWEAGYVRDMLVSTVGWDEEYLWEHRTEPLVIRIDVDAILSELGIAGLFDESDAEITRREDAVDVVYDVLGPDGTWTCSDPTAPPLSREAIEALEAWVRPGYKVYREPTPEQDAELERLQSLRDGLEALREQEWAAYGQAFQASVLAELEREPVKGLWVPVEFDIDARTWPPPAAATAGNEALPWALERLHEAGWLNTPLPGSGIAPRDYPAGADIAQVERDAGRLPHQRLKDGQGS